MFVSCPDPACHAPAEILDRYTLGSTDGRWEHVRTYCVRRHIFVLPTERVPGIWTWSRSRRIQDFHRHPLN
jgi:hypothetical protein